MSWGTFGIVYERAVNIKLHLLLVSMLVQRIDLG